MTPKDVLENAVDPALALLDRVAGVRPSQEARVLLMAIAGQESAWQYRVQIGGPAHSFWQFEKSGGVHGVLHHPSSSANIRDVCADLGVSCDETTIYQRMAEPEGDVLPGCMARLLLWTDPAPLPAVGDVDHAWNFYERNWRPGAPHPEGWPARYAIARGLVNA